VLTKQVLRARWREAQKLFAEWGPIGFPTPIDEYDCMVGPALRLLEEGASAEQLSAYFEKELSEHFGLTVRPGAVAEFSETLVRWYRGKREATQ
jgi:hypothetical protein